MPDGAELTVHGVDDDDQVVAWAEEGRLVVAGEPAAVDAFIADLKPERTLDLESVKALAAGVGSLAAAPAARLAKRYVELGVDRWRALESTADTRSALHRITWNVKTGRIVANTPVKNVVAVTQPEVLIALAAIQMAIQSLTDAVEEVAKDVDDLKRFAETADVGNLAGLYRVLANARAQVDRTGTISRTTWESIATHEVTAQQSADRLRAYLRSVLEDFPLKRDAGDRHDFAQRLVKEGNIRRSLRLLVLAEQCRLLWRSLKLDEVRVAEPDHLGSEAEAAKALLSENAHADRELAQALRDGVGRLTHLSPLDGARLRTRSRLPTAAAVLQSHIDEFTTARRQQLDSWAPVHTPGLRDAAREIGKRATDAASKGRDLVGAAASRGRDAVGGKIAEFGTWVQRSTNTDEPQPGSSGEGTSTSRSVEAATSGHAAEQPEDDPHSAGLR